MAHYEFDQFTAVRLHTSAAYSHDGKQVAFIANTTGQFNIWVIPSGGGAARQLTAFQDWAVRQLVWSHDDSKIAFTADKDGDENRQVYVIESAGGWAKLISAKLDRQYDLAGWSPDDSKLLYTANDEAEGDKDPIEHNLETGELRRLMTGNLNFAGGYSPNGQYINVVRFAGNTEQNVFVVEEASGEAALASPHEGEAIFFAGDWKPDSSGFFMITNYHQEYNNLAFYDLEKGKWDWYYQGNHDVDGIDVSEAANMVLILTNEGGTSKLHAFDLDTRAPIEIAELPVGVIGGMSLAKDGTKIVCNFTSAREAANIYEFNLQTGEMTALSQSMLGGINIDDLVDPELIHYETFDGKQIPAWLYKPTTDGDTFPVVLSIHGGPESQERPTYNYAGLYQYLLNRGIGVLAPNVRGSTGFGISYQTAIHRDWGGAELKDFEHAVEYLHSLDWVNQDRIAVFGGSFGGFATLSCVTRLPDYWAAAVDIVGPCNLVTFVKSVPEHWKPIMKTWVGDAEEDYDMLMERSPITYVENIKAPLLVIQGANDPRVVKAESDQMVAAMEDLGIDVTYYVDPEEGHGATRTKNRNKWMRMTAEYLESHLNPVSEGVAGD
ncbi:MAG: S9 family peptidase [Phototrophicaceae bacterium]